MRYIRSSLRNLERLPAVVRDMNGYFWRTDDSLVHHMRGESVADVRARIAATHRDEVARRAVLTSLHPPPPTTPSKSAAARRPHLAPRAPPHPYPTDPSEV